MSKGRHKGKIQLSIGLPFQTAHPTYPMRSFFFLIYKKKTKQNQKQNFKFSVLAKTLSEGYKQLNIFEVRHSTTSTFAKL